MDGPSKNVCSGRSIVDGQNVRKIRVVAVALQKSRYVAGRCRALNAPFAFVVAEEEELVLEDRAAGGSAELVQAEFSPS